MTPCSSRVTRQAWRWTLSLGLALGWAGSALAQGAMGQPAPKIDTQQDKILKEVRLDQKLNAPVPQQLAFKDEAGKDVKLGDYFDRPVMMMLIQFRCTMLCTEQMAVLVDSVKQLQFTPGKEYNLLIISIDSREKPDLAADMKRSMLEKIERPSAAAGLHFLTGEDSSINALSEAVGFHFRYDARTDQFAHPDGVIIATPAGKVARYFFRLEYPARDMRYALIEAAGNRIGTLVDAFALLCFHYNPVTGKYGLAVLSVVRLAGIATVLMLCLGLVVMKRRDRVAKTAVVEAPLKVEG